MRQGVLIFSLDFELDWGVFDTKDDKYSQKILGAREAVPRILEEFDKHDVHATWACVGFLFAERKVEIDSLIPAKDSRPTYVNRELYAYEVNIGKNEQTDPLHYAKSLIQRIKSTSGQEIATHTFSHYYCLEQGQTAKQFQADIKAAINAADNLGVSLKSIVFPRNQVNDNYLSLLKKYGIKSYRGTNPAKIYQANSGKEYNRIIYRLLRLVDSYINITGYGTYDLNPTDVNTSCMNLQGSRFFRPYSANFSFLEPLKLRRIKKSMEYAAKNNQVYHLWWHPHNFGNNLKENMRNLRNILSYYRFLSREYNMKSVNMKELPTS